MLNPSCLDHVPTETRGFSTSNSLMQGTMTSTSPLHFLGKFTALMPFWTWHQKGKLPHGSEKSRKTNLRMVKFSQNSILMLRDYHEIEILKLHNFINGVVFQWTSETSGFSNEKIWGLDGGFGGRRRRRGFFWVPPIPPQTVQNNIYKSEQIWTKW